MTGHCGHLIDVLVLVLHRRAHGCVSHDIHDREQVLGATWLWNRTSRQQRTALYASGLGTEPGLFIDGHREELIDSLAQLHSAFLVADPQLAGDAAVRFAAIVLDHPFFGVRT